MMALALRLFWYAELSSYVIAVLALMLLVDALSRRARRQIGRDGTRMPIAASAMTGHPS